MRVVARQGFYCTVHAVHKKIVIRDIIMMCCSNDFVCSVKYASECPFEASIHSTATVEVGLAIQTEIVLQ